jgi:acid phosphatase
MRLRARRTFTILACAVLVVWASGARALAAGTVPWFAHVVVVVEENHSYAEIHGNSSAPYINSLMRTGANFSNSYAITHPSEPNYLALFSGSTHGVTSDYCPYTFGTDNLAHEVRASGRIFLDYAESLPYAGDQICTAGAYARKHVPSTDFSDVQTSVNRQFTQFQQTSYGALPRMSFVIPNLNDDMHNGSIATGDAWLKYHLSGYVTWAKTHDSVLIVVWDEDDSSQSNKIPTLIVGAHVKTGTYTEYTNHYRLLRTIEAVYGLPALGSASTYAPITDVWD